MKEFDEDKEKDKRDVYDRDREVRELLGLSVKAAKDNPALALSLARRVLHYPLNNSWYSSLYQIAGNNQPLADQIYGEALDNYANAEVFAFYIFRLIRLVMKEFLVLKVQPWAQAFQMISLRIQT